jgi:hypothetical protein
MALSNRQTADAYAIKALLPWHAAGALDVHDARQVVAALARDRDLARTYAVIRDEHAEVVLLNERLGAPSPRAMHSLFAAIDAEPRRGLSRSTHGSPERAAIGICGIATALLAGRTAARDPANDAGIKSGCACRTVQC